MIASNLRLVLIISIISYFVIILLLLKKKSLSLKYTLLWLFAGLVLCLMVIRPDLLYWFTHALGIIDAMNGLFVLCIAFIIMILMSLTAIASGQAEKIKNLTQTISKMEKRIRELEERK